MCSHKLKIQNISDRSFILSPGSCPRGGTLGHKGCAGDHHFFKHVAYQIDGDDKQNRMQVKFSSQGQTGDLGVRSKGHILLNFGYHVHFKDFLYQTLCVFSQIKDRNILNISFILLLGSCPRGGTWGRLRVKNLAWGYAMAPNRLRALV